MVVTMRKAVSGLLVIFITAAAAAYFYYRWHSIKNTEVYLVALAKLAENSTDGDKFDLISYQRAKSGNGFMGEYVSFVFRTKSGEKVKLLLQNREDRWEVVEIHRIPID